MFKSVVRFQLLPRRAFAIGLALLAPAAFSQTALNNGARQVGTLAANTADTYSFVGTAGASVVIRIGTTNFVPKLELIAPGGTIIQTVPASNPGGGNRDAEIDQALTTPGQYLVRVTSYFAGGTGGYGLSYVQAPGAFTVAAGDEGGPMVNGSRYAGVIEIGDVDAWTFTGHTGDSIQLRVGMTDFAPRLELYAPDGKRMTNVPTANPGGGNRDQLIDLRLVADGTYTVLVSSYFSLGSGNAPSAYQLSFVQAPGAPAISANDEGGPLPNGGRVSGHLEAGDLDSWTFEASAGDSILLRAAAAELAPRLDLYGPDGARIDIEPPSNPGGGNRDQLISTRATATGTYTVVVSSYFFGVPGPAANYNLSLVKAPGAITIAAGDEGGPLSNGVRVNGTIDPGDLDAWTFNGKAGDSVQIRVGMADFAPDLRLYGPDGTLISTAPPSNPGGGNRDQYIAKRLTADGPYTVVVSSFFLAGGGTGPSAYSLSFAQAPGDFSTAAGDEGGALVNGGTAAGTLDVGDLDLYSFNANAGDYVQVRIGTADYAPQMDIYGPDGALVDTIPSSNPGGANRDNIFEQRLALSGNYLVVVSSYFLLGGGNAPTTYSLNYFKAPGTIAISPGDQGGSLTNGWLHVGNIDPGDVDAWTFEGKAGEDIVVRIGATNLAPRLDLFAPSGALVKSLPPSNPGGASRDQVITNRLTETGTYTVLASSYFLNGSSSYWLSLVQSSDPAVQAAPGDEGGSMINGYRYIGTNIMGDIEVFSFYGTVGDSNVFRIGTTNFTPWMQVYGPDGRALKEAFVNNGNNRTNELSFYVTNNGVYTFTATAYFLNQNGTYNLKQSRVPPDINMPASIAIDEGTALNVAISAQDPDQPNKSLTFLLQDAPPGVTINTLGATNAAIAWNTTEATGPSTNTFRVTVTDVVDNVPFTRTNVFTVIVNEVNVAPVLTVPPNTTVDELAPLASLSASAQDADLPANPLTFALVSPPAGMTIDPATGAIAWTPSEDQGPGAYPITVVVTDDSPSAINAQHLSATNTFTITVRELNTPPQAAIPDQVIDEGKQLSLIVVPTDSDRPANTFSFALANPPAGLVINPATGALTWTPAENQGPSTNLVSVVVTDNNPDAANEKQLSTTASFNVVVREVNTPPVLGTIAQQTVNELSTLTVTNLATDGDLPANALTYALAGAPAGAQINAQGVITWQPSEAQGPTNITITTVVTDNGTPALSATNSFVVVVREVNTAPVFSVPAEAQSTEELKPFSYTVNASDSDLPANPLSYRLIAPPEGMSINNSGVITWTPTEAQGPGSYPVTIVVSDTSAAESNAQLSTTNTFTLNVTETNSPPVIADIPNQTIHFGTPLSFTPDVTDSDLPANSVTLSLEGAPTGMTLDAAAGTINWTPLEAQLGVFTVTLKAADNGTPSLTSSKTFQVTVTGSGSRLEVTQLPNNLIRITITGDSGHDYELQRSADLTNWETFIRLSMKEKPFEQIEQTTAARLFYRLKLLQ